jgi:hypothetical protein
MVENYGNRHKRRICNTLLLDSNNGFTNAPEFYVIGPLPALLELGLTMLCVPKTDD